MLRTHLVENLFSQQRSQQFGTYESTLPRLHKNSMLTAHLSKLPSGNDCFDLLQNPYFILKVR